MINRGLPSLAKLAFGSSGLCQVLLYGDVVHDSSCSLVLVSRHECVATVGDFYTVDANARLN
jgi:hypothetical protein